MHPTTLAISFTALLLLAAAPNPPAPKPATAPTPAAASAKEPEHITIQHVLIGFTGTVPGKTITRTQDDGWGAEVMPDDSLGAQVRWRPGRFSRLNDVAYAHGGRILVAIVRRRTM